MTANSGAIGERLRAWMAGDLDALERLLHLRAVEPGSWDCMNRAPMIIAVWAGNCWANGLGVRA